MKRIAIFGSGAGTNAENIIRYFRNHPSVEVSLIVSNKPDSGIVQKAKSYGIPVSVVERKTFEDCTDLVRNLAELKTDLIVLAGFLWKIPDVLLKAYHNRIVNIHPSLLPKYGGKGMYGSKVHQAVKAAGDAETGITIHYVNEHYDEGEIIHQEKVIVGPNDSEEEIAQKVQELEHQLFPRTIEKLLA